MKHLKGGHLGNAGRCRVYVKLEIVKVVSEEADGYNRLSAVSTGGIRY
jgi:hypothetical protein